MEVSVQFNKLSISISLWLISNPNEDFREILDTKAGTLFMKGCRVQILPFHQIWAQLKRSMTSVSKSEVKAQIELLVQVMDAVETVLFHLIYILAMTFKKAYVMSDLG